MTPKPDDLIARIGEPGSYSDIAVRHMFGEDTKILRCGSFRECLKAANDGKAEQAVVPARNSITGEITDVPSGPSVAEMALEMNLVRTQEYRLPVRHVLASRGSIKEIKAVYSKRQAIEQCGMLCKTHNWITAYTTPDGKIITDTSAAAKHVAQTGVAYAAAICSAEAAGRHGLPVIMDRGVADKEDNHTVFFAYRRVAD